MTGCHLEPAQTKLATRSLPQLCNLQAHRDVRVAYEWFRGRGWAAEDDAYGSEFAYIYLASTDFRNALSALLLLGSCTSVYKYGLALNQLN